MFKLTESYLTPNEFSRPKTKLASVKGVVIHWVANPKTSASANRNFFEMRKEGTAGYGSAHFIVNLDGNVIKCIPEDEIAYHVGAKKYTDLALKNLGSYPNNCTIGIECTHVDWNGKMTDATYESLVELSSNLINRYKLNPEKDLYIHHDITGKNCHKWFLDNNDQWLEFKKKVAAFNNAGNRNGISDSPLSEMLTTLGTWFRTNPEEWKKFKNQVEV